jgi:GT2 family glycosyltransferase
MKRIAVLLTCHNRYAKTIACLEALFLNHLPEGYSLEVFLVDDGSKDGTNEAVKWQFPAVHLIEGDGNLYWNGGMRVAFAAAMRQGFDYYLWLNDDTTLYKNTLCTLLETTQALTHKQGRATIIVGATQDQQGCASTYGGLIRTSCWRPLKFILVPTSDVPVTCDTMNGNCVLIPSIIANTLGNLDDAFVHTMGDIDYGLRACKAGFSIMVMPGFAGSCRRNSTNNTRSNARVSCFERCKNITDHKELPPRAWYVLTRRHAGLLWPIFWVWPYLKALFGVAR